jgi:hypothetical protein
MPEVEGKQLKGQIWRDENERKTDAQTVSLFRENVRFYCSAIMSVYHFRIIIFNR